MLVLTRKVKESITIGNNITVTVLEIRGNQIRVGIEAPRSTPINRTEIYESIAQENIKASKLPQKMDRLQKGMAPPAVDTSTKKVVKKEPISQEKRQYHTVRGGDTLYSIARKYRISLNELRRINNLTPNQDIYPNQKLLVTP